MCNKESLMNQEISSISYSFNKRFVRKVKYSFLVWIIFVVIPAVKIFLQPISFLSVLTLYYDVLQFQQL